MPARNRLRVRPVALCALILAAGGARAAEDGGAAAGRQLYMSRGCYECHGTVAQGSSFTGPRLAPPVAPYETFIGQLRNPTGEMPPYEAKVLSDRDAAAIYAFLKTIPEPPAAASLPLLK